MTRTYVFEAPDGSQVLVTLWPGGTVEVAQRTNQFGTWGPPLTLVRTETS